MTAMTMAASDVSLLPMRASLGATMLYHGAGKLRGEGARQSAGFFEQLGLRPGARWAALAGATAVLGIGTRLGAAAVLATQAVAIAKVHRGKGFSNVAGGYEFNAMIMAVALALLAAGPGRLSAHEALEHRLERGGGWRRRLRARPGRAVRAVTLLK